MKTINLKYDISKTTAPKMPKLGKGTECVQLLLSQVSKDMHEPLVHGISVSRPQLEGIMWHDGQSRCRFGLQ